MLTRKKASDISPGLAVAGPASFLWATSCTVPLHPAGKAPGEEEEERTYVVIGSVFPYSWYVYWGPAFHEAAGQLPAKGKQWMNSSVSLVHRAFSFPFLSLFSCHCLNPQVCSPSCFVPISQERGVRARVHIWLLTGVSHSHSHSRIHRHPGMGSGWDQKLEINQMHRNITDHDILQVFKQSFIRDHLDF